jgi:hypothetical protein
VGSCRSEHLAPLHTGADPRSAIPGIDLERVETSGAQQDYSLRVTGGTVPAGLGRDSQPGRAGIADERGRVICVGGLDDGEDWLVDGQVPRAPRPFDVVGGQEH